MIVVLPKGHRGVCAVRLASRRVWRHWRKLDLKKLPDYAQD
jgi:hypothetical protein